MSSLSEQIIMLPSLDLNAGEDLEQALKNFSILENNFSKFCANLNSRLSNLKGKLGCINERIGNSRNKIDALTNVNQAITIVNPSRFVRDSRSKQDVASVDAVNPSYVNNQRISEFDYENNMNLNLKFSTSSSENISPKRRENDNDEELKDIIKLTKGTIKPKRELFSGTHAIQQQSMEGLGRIPKKIRYVDSLVVFNSKKNPFQKYQSFDNLTSDNTIKVPRRRGGKDKDAYTLHEAPQTLTAGDTLARSTAQGFEFIPEVKELPQLSAPTTLGLAGIVNINSNNADSDIIMLIRGRIPLNKEVLADPHIQVEEEKANPPREQTKLLPSHNVRKNSYNPSSSSSQSDETPPLIIQQSDALNPKQNESEDGQINNSAAIAKPEEIPKEENMIPPPPLTKATGSHAAILEEIKNPKNLLKLKKAIPIERPSFPTYPRPMILNEIISFSRTSGLRKMVPVEKRKEIIEARNKNDGGDIDGILEKRREMVLRMKLKKLRREESSESDEDD